MLPLNAHRRNSQGFTMIELLIIVMLVGILSAISAPSFLGILNRNKVNNALAQTQGALREAQREAIRRSKACTLNFNSSANPPTIGGGCLTTGTRALQDVTMVVNPSGTTSVGFNFKGESTAAITVVLSHSGTQEQKCVVMSSPLALIRTGVVEAGNCRIIQN